MRIYKTFGCVVTGLQPCSSLSSLQECLRSFRVVVVGPLIQTLTRGLQLVLFYGVLKLSG